MRRGRCGSRCICSLCSKSRAKTQREEKNISRKKAQNTQNRRRYKARVVGGEVAEDLFERGLCLPSGTAMTEGDLDRVIETIFNSRKGT